MMKVRCNNCLSVFDEKYLVAHDNGDDLICPCCGQVGCIMDVPEEEFPQYYNDAPLDNKTSAGVITTRFYNDGCAKGIQILLNDEIVCMLDVFTAESDGSPGEARVLVYQANSDEPTNCISINR